jgi:hypothetical protein
MDLWCLASTGPGFLLGTEVVHGWAFEVTVGGHG